LPYGQYNICVDNGLGGSSARSVTTSTPVANTSEDGTSLIVIDVNNSSTHASCP
jgi:hypothetical protein